MPALGAILTAVVTPFGADERVDEEAFVRILEHLADHGSDGVVVAGTTGEAATLSDDEQVALVELAVREMGERMTIVGGAGSNDTRHAATLTERVCAAGADAVLSVTPYYVRPNRRGIVRHFEEVSRAADRPIVLYNIPTRTGIDMPNDLLAELAQLDHVEAVKQANHANLAKVDGLAIYAGNDDMLADVLDLGEAGGVLVASHVVGHEMRRMVDEPDRRRAIEDELRDVYAALSVAPAACAVKGALRLLGLDAGVPRLPYVELEPDELETVRAALERHGLLARA